MKILLVTNYTTLSAYAIQARMLVPQLQALGHEVVVVDVRSGPGSMTAQVGDTIVLPTVFDPLGNDIIPAHYERSQANVCVSYPDVWGFSPETMQQVNWWPITPIDHSPVPPAVRSSLSAARGILALSRFGQAELKRIGRESFYTPNGVDPAIWWPALTDMDMRMARARLKIADEDLFVVSFVGVNDSQPSRKGIAELLIAWAMFIQKYPQSVLLLHTSAQGNIPLAGPKHGVDIPQIIQTFEIPPHSIALPDQYRLRTGIPAQELADMARASDLFILPSRGEGFGVPLVEFQHAGCPAATTDFGAGAELCASGWLIDGEVEWSWQNATVVKPGIASICETLEKAYAERGNMARRREAAEFGRNFDIDLIVKRYYIPALTQMAEEIVAAA